MHPSNMQALGSGIRMNTHLTQHRGSQAYSYDVRENRNLSRNNDAPLYDNLEPPPPSYDEACKMIQF